MINRPRAVSALALPVVLMLAGCSSSGGATAAPSQAAASAAPSTAASAPASAPAASVGASIAASGGTAESYPLGVMTAAGATFLTGEDGKSLYVFAKDTANNGKSVCNATCADNWPAYKADDLDEVKADASATGKLSIVTRDDGSKQLAYNGMPLYYFAGDKAAGDTNGKAIANWALATP